MGLEILNGFYFFNVILTQSNSTQIWPLDIRKVKSFGTGLEWFNVNIVFVNIGRKSPYIERSAVSSNGAPV